MVSYRVLPVKRQVRFSPDKSSPPAPLQPGAEEARTSSSSRKREEDQQKGFGMLAALSSGGSLNLSQELMLRDCCFKWKRGGFLLCTSWDSDSHMFMQQHISTHATCYSDCSSDCRSHFIYAVKFTHQFLLSPIQQCLLACCQTDSVELIAS